MNIFYIEEIKNARYIFCKQYVNNLVLIVDFIRKIVKSESLGGISGGVFFYLQNQERKLKWTRDLLKSI